jgi:hypothetical protein
MCLQYFLFNSIQGRRDRFDLRHDINAIAAALDHLLDTFDLAVYLVQSYQLIVVTWMHVCDSCSSYGDKAGQGGNQPSMVSVYTLQG